MGVEQERKKLQIHQRETDTSRKVAENTKSNVWPSLGVKRDRDAENGPNSQIDVPKATATTETNPVRDITIEEATPIGTSSQSTQAVCTPFIGMEFDTIKMVDDFWEQYGRDVGFGGRIHYGHKSRKDGVVLSKTYLCCRAGLKVEDKRRINSKRRPETRCECPVKFVVCLNREKGKYYVKQFIENHNHLLEGKRTIHLIRAHRGSDKIQACDIDVSPHAGLGNTTTHRSHLRTKRSKNLPYGEAGAILDYFDKQSNLSSSFFRAFQFDCEDKITNFFWTDSKMLINYQAFGDVVTFYTAFGTNGESRPLGIFTGYNNYRQTVIFGGTLLYGETTESFAWALNKFIECHGGKYPGIIFTDQDLAMEEALAVVMPNVRHGLCSWHISQKARKNLSGTLGNKLKSFYDEFQKCMYEYLDVYLFEGKWKNMLESFGLVGNKWLEALYGTKNQWCLAYMKDVFTAGIRSTQSSGIVNARLKKDLVSGISMENFFISFDLFLVEVRNMESKSDCSSRQTSPHLAAKSSCILRQAAEIYTPNMFQLFFEEWDLEHAITLDMFWGSIGTPHVRIAKDEDTFYEVNFNASTMTISCSCCKYEMCGYLCGHILRVFNVYDIREIPEKYIMKRWTIHAKRDLTSVVSRTPDLTGKQKFDVLCSEWAAVARRACSKDVPFDLFVRRFISGAHAFIDEYENRGMSDNDINSRESGYPSSFKS